jgi:hypothetical protein
VERKGEEAVWGAGSGEVKGCVFWEKTLEVSAR